MHSSQSVGKMYVDDMMLDCVSESQRWELWSEREWVGMAQGWEEERWCGKYNDIMELIR